MGAVSDGSHVERHPPHHLPSPSTGLYPAVACGPAARVPRHHLLHPPSRSALPLTARWQPICTPNFPPTIRCAQPSLSRPLARDTPASLAPYHGWGRQRRRSAITSRPLGRSDRCRDCRRRRGDGSGGGCGRGRSCNVVRRGVPGPHRGRPQPGLGVGRRVGTGTEAGCRRRVCRRVLRGQPARVVRSFGTDRRRGVRRRQEDRRRRGGVGDLHQVGGRRPPSR
ncbi:hypothetical protein BU14_0205s0008 [Porphyra umbilicalis]|uniref:Uncharacterized protein n=1 Tax=Porphyra umbilicalis TaxID=2786 RepID=A0A1X6P682_PORUM|nr:hypothetical protein BU14_0205s0008 [Porphyra umbilicalis]|eukprot:OSX76133.1 hypothetical protein BU14_0205s0008 [Porphyra umbilicalis]